MPESAGSSVRRFASSPVRQLACPLVRRFASWPVRWFAGSPVGLFAGSPVRQLVCSLVRRFASWSVRWLASRAVGWLLALETDNDLVPCLAGSRPHRARNECGDRAGRYAGLENHLEVARLASVRVVVHRRGALDHAGYAAILIEDGRAAQIR